MEFWYDYAMLKGNKLHIYQNATFTFVKKIIVLYALYATRLGCGWLVGPGFEPRQKFEIDI